MFVVAGRLPDGRQPPGMMVTCRAAGSSGSGRRDAMNRGSSLHAVTISPMRSELAECRTTLGDRRCRHFSLDPAARFHRYTRHAPARRQPGRDPDALATV